MTIAVDFDGVIHAYSKGWRDGSIYDELMKDSLWGLQVLMSNYPVFIFTARNPRQVAEWIEKESNHIIECTTTIPREWYGRRKGFWNIRGYLLVTDRKLPASVYIDDRAYRFESWEKTIQDNVKGATRD